MNNYRYEIATPTTDGVDGVEDAPQETDPSSREGVDDFEAIPPARVQAIPSSLDIDTTSLPVAPVVEQSTPPPTTGLQGGHNTSSPVADDFGTLLIFLCVAVASFLAGRAFPWSRSCAIRQTSLEGQDQVMHDDGVNKRLTDDRSRLEIMPLLDPSSQSLPEPPVSAPAATSHVIPESASPSQAQQPTSSPVIDPQTQPPTPSNEPQAALPKPLSAERLATATIDAIRDTRAAHSHQSWGSFNRDALPKLLFYGGNRFCQFSADALEAADEWFVIGDIHGDFYALHSLVSHIRKACPGFGIIFLGDLIDRGPHPIECLWYLLKVADDHPNRVLWLAGNHDVGVHFDDRAGIFRSTVEPAEFVSDLNIVDSCAPLRRAFGQEYIELSRGLPRAAVMPDGLLLTHGGFPHTDLQQELSALSFGADRRKWLESEPVIRDFTNLRITKYPMRRPNRLSIGCSYGYKDFETFKEAMSGYNIKRIVTGHQHVTTGCDDHPDWAKNGQEALTLTGFGFADAYERLEAYSTHYRRTLVCGRCRPDQLPEVISIPIDEQDLGLFCDAEIATMPRFAAD